VIPGNPFHPQRRLDYAVIRDPLTSLAEAAVLRLERDPPRELGAINGGQPLFTLLARLAQTTFDSVAYLCAEKPEDPARRIAFASSPPPLLRALLDEIFTVVFLSQDLPARIGWYYRSGWGEMLANYERYRAQYAGTPEWDEWLAHWRAWLDETRDSGYVTAAEAGAPDTIPIWPTPSQMLRKQSQIGAEARDCRDYLYASFYREFSQEDHLSLPGLMSRGSTFLRGQDDPLKEGEWRKKRSDAVSSAVVLLLAFLSESIIKFGWPDLRERAEYFWRILVDYSPIAAEVYGTRYRARLSPSDPT
jgi:hypothetical protein